MAVTADARAQAAAGEGITLGRQAHTVRHGQGCTAWRERLETEVVGLIGLTTDDHYGTAEHGRHWPPPSSQERFWLQLYPYTDAIGAVHVEHIDGCPAPRV
jgi:hypothetical protein